MIFTNLILSSILSLQPVEGFETSMNYGFNINYTTNEITLFSKKKDLLDDEENIRLISYLQSVDLIFQDIYEYTKPNLYKQINNNLTAGELNPVANFFFKNNLWDLAFASANVFNYLIFNIDSLYPIYSVVLNAAEIWAISTWSIATTNEINVEASLFIYTF